MAKIICICGKAGSGKDTVADYLVEKYEFIKISFADELKRIAKQVFGFSNETLWGPSELRNIPDKRYPLPNGEFLVPRKVLIEWGDAGRDCYPTIWAERTVNIAKQILTGEFSYTQYDGIKEKHYYIKSTAKNISGIVFSDARFINELEESKKIDSKTIRIDRDIYKLAGELSSHKSEKEQESIPHSYYDYLLENFGIKEDLYRKIDKIIVKI